MLIIVTILIFGYIILIAGVVSENKKQTEQDLSRLLIYIDSLDIHPTKKHRIINYIRETL